MCDKCHDRQCDNLTKLQNLFRATPEIKKIYRDTFSKNIFRASPEIKISPRRLSPEKKAKSQIATPTRVSPEVVRGTVLTSSDPSQLRKLGTQKTLSLGKKTKRTYLRCFLKLSSVDAYTVLDSCINLSPTYKRVWAPEQN